MTTLALNMTTGTPFVPKGGRWRCLAALTTTEGKRMFIDAYYLNNHTLVDEDEEETKNTGWFVSDDAREETFTRITWGTIDMWAEWPVYSAGMAPSATEPRKEQP